MEKGGTALKNEENGDFSDIMLIPELIAVKRDDYNQDYLSYLDAAREKIPPREMATRLPEFIFSAEKVFLWGMSLTTFPDLHRLLYSEVRKGHGIETRALIGHPQGVGKVWIEPEHPHNGIERRRGRILWAARDFKEVGAEVKLLYTDELPLTSGVSIDNRWMTLIPYNYSFSTKSGKKFPLELKTTLEGDRFMSIFEGDLVEKIMKEQFERLYGRKE